MILKHPKKVKPSFIYMKTVKSKHYTIMRKKKFLFVNCEKKIPQQFKIFSVSFKSGF